MDGIEARRRGRGARGAAARRLLAIALAVAAALASGAPAGARDEGTAARGTVTVVVVGAARAAGPVCLVPRDETVGMVVGAYCDGDVTDRDVAPGRIGLELPRRTFAVDAQAPGVRVAGIVPRRFTLGRRQTIVVRLSAMGGPSGTEKH